MRNKILLATTLVLIFISFFVSLAFAQTYSFSVPEYTVNVYWNENGTASIDYEIVFENSPFASPIDYVDLGLPNRNFELTSISAEVDGQPIQNISASDFQGEGDAGVALGLGSNAIQPGEQGTVHAYIGTVRDVLYRDDEDNNYVSAVFIPNYFGAQYVSGTTDMCVLFHFPPEVQPDEPRWHESPSGFPSEPDTGFDDQDRIVYRWCNPSASASSAYTFGASFPATYAPESEIVTPSFIQSTGINLDNLLGFSCCGGVFLLIGLIVFASIRSTQRRKMQYLSPKIAIEGHGIKRGLTAVEAAILLEQPMDKILTMILFSTIKKQAATVTKKDPLELEVADPLPEKLHPYEVQFLEAFKKTSKADQRKALQEAMIDLVNSLSKKMKGFSRKETIAYYKNIVERAWKQVEAADTPEVKSEKFNENLEWTMLDRDYDRRTRDVFRTGPVFVPIWWPRYDPSYPRPSAPATGGPAIPSGRGTSVSLPHLPGSDFAASIVNGVQNMSAGVVGSLTGFTGAVTQKTNPIPVSTTSGRSISSGRSGGGCACACACACAGCACACAGGGR